MIIKRLYQPLVTQIRGCHHGKNILSLSDRGFFQALFPGNAEPEIRKRFITKPQTIYAGFDPTADSLHVGNLLVIMGLIHCQRGGHQPIALLGGATGRIGDPSGRNSERSLMDVSSVEHNLSAIQRQIETIFENHEKFFWNKKSAAPALSRVKIVNNADWYRNLSVVGFIANIGRHFRLGDMITMSSVQQRLQGDGMSFTEFTYQVFQAYDWLHLLKEHDCRFQLGGSDQMGNLVAGHRLIGRTAKKSVYGLTLPLITNEEGNKFGKSAGNAIWLDQDKTSPFSFYQFFIRIADSEVENLLKLLTLLPLKEIDEIMVQHKQVPELRQAQRKLAQQITLLVHGETGLQKAEAISSALYKGSVDALGKLNLNEVKECFAGAALCEILPAPGMTILEAAMKCKCFASERDAMRIITAGGFYINQNQTKNIAEVLSPSVHVLENGLTLFRVGKKNYYIVTWL
ncbi:tyrosine--tRNA ligase, mitochondrial-like [Bradysia coprophila]|uniref:tyrosine--tRNA ligase, mitochondrial-like n=1 Tax=Bradysia coprophila TaxID=38358 RepID=UPI00187D8AB9|nr:tyrosine--tRNA ligase, mitochondrial-like [Bradysia coprophila]